MSIYGKTSFRFSISADVTTRFDQIFWFGDFNFRLSKARVDVDAIISGIMGDDMGPLFEHDQLSNVMKDGMLTSFELQSRENLNIFSLLQWLPYWLFSVKVQSLRASRRHRYTSCPPINSTLAAISMTAPRNKELLHTQYVKTVRPDLFHTRGCESLFWPVHPSNASTVIFLFTGQNIVQEQIRRGHKSDQVHKLL